MNSNMLNFEVNQHMGNGLNDMNH